MKLGGLVADLAPLRESPAFRRLWLGSTFSSVGTALTAYAVPLQVYEITRSPFAVGAIGLAEMVPTLGLGLLGGTVADAVDRRRLVLVMTSCLAAVSGALAAQSFAGLRAVWLLYGLVAVQSTLGSVNAPARRTIVPSLLAPERVPAALALNRLSFQVMLTLGPGLAGLVTAAPSLGLRACYLLDAGSFAASLYGLARLPPMPPREGAERPGRRAIADGLRFVKEDEILLGTFLTDLNATVFALPVALFPAINAARFHGDPRTLGLFTTAIGVGGLVSAALSGPVGRCVRQGAAMLATTALWGAAFAGFAVVRSLWATLLLLGLAGAVDTVSVVLRGTVVQAVTPDHLRGRVTAAEYVVGAGGGELGNVEAGALGSLTSPTTAALAGGLATVAGVALVAAALPAFARYRAGARPASGGAEHGEGAVEPLDRDVVPPVLLPGGAEEA